MDLKTFLLVVSMVTMNIGSYSHLEAEWTTFNHHSEKYAYQMCDSWPSGRDGVPPCPSINLEHFFISMLILCLLWSIASFMLSVVRFDGIVALDSGGHAILGLLLFISSIGYLASTKQIERLQTFSRSLLNWQHLYLKMAAGGLGLFQSLLHVFLAGKLLFS